MRIEHCPNCLHELEYQGDAQADQYPLDRLEPGEWVEMWDCPQCLKSWFIIVEAESGQPAQQETPATVTLDEWVGRFDGLQQSSRELWKQIRWEFEQQQPPMTVRQMFYRMSSIGAVPKTENGYRKVQYQLTNMRHAGAIPYGWLADNTRWVRKPNSYTGLDDALTDMQQYYRRSLWAYQDVHVEIWLEKDALAGVISEVTSEFDVPLYVTRGYPSISYLHEAAESLKSIDRPRYVYHFGDYDASGQDAARAIREGLERFGAEFTFIQVAVTPEQIRSMGLQTRPSKKSDPRAAKHGSIAVELDAIPPAELRRLVRETIEAHVDPYWLEHVRNIEQHEREVISDWIGNL